MKYFNYKIAMLVLFTVTVLNFFACEEDEVKGLATSEVTAEFTANATDIETGGVVVFSDQSTGDVSHWSWVFEGGTPEISNEQNPEVVYSGPGTFEVKLVASNFYHTNVTVKTAYINVAEGPLPISADFEASSTNILGGESINFTDLSSGNPTTWDWQFDSSEGGASLTASGQNPEVVFTDPGVYSVTLTASNSEYSSEETKTDYITVIDAAEVAADFTVDALLTYEGGTVGFSNVSVGNVETLSWTFEGGTPENSSEANPSVTYTVAGEYKVTLEASNSSNSDILEIEGYIKVIPGNDLVAMLPFNGNVSDQGPLGLTVNSGPGITFDGTDRNTNTNATAVFDGSAPIRIPATAEKQFGTGSFSVGLWLKTDNPAETWLWQEGGADSPQTAWFRINNNATTRLYSFLPNLGGIINTSDAEGTILSDDVWHHVVCVREASGMAKIYVDGAFIEERSLTIEDLTNDIGFMLGGRDNGAGLSDSHFNGQIDDVVIYTRALTESEITFLSGI